MILHAYRFELDPNETQRVRLAKTVGASRFVYNWGLELSMRCKQLGIVPLPEGLREVTPVERKALAPEASGVKPASLIQEASGRRSNGRHTQSRVETLAGVVANGI
jgi:transposase